MEQQTLPTTQAIAGLEKKLPTYCEECGRNVGNDDEKFRKGIYYVPSQGRYFTPSISVENQPFDSDNTVYFCTTCVTKRFLSTNASKCKRCRTMQDYDEGFMARINFIKRKIVGNFKIGTLLFKPGLEKEIGNLKQNDEICNHCVKELVEKNLLETGPGFIGFSNESPLPCQWNEENQCYDFKIDNNDEETEEEEGEENEATKRWAAISNEKDQSRQQEQANQICALCCRHWDADNVIDFPRGPLISEWNYFYDPSHYICPKNCQYETKEPIQPLIPDPVYPLWVCNICLKAKISAQQISCVECTLCHKKYPSEMGSKFEAQCCSSYLSHRYITTGYGSRYDGTYFGWKTPLMPPILHDMFLQFKRKSIVCDSCINRLIEEEIIYPVDGR